MGKLKYLLRYVSKFLIQSKDRGMHRDILPAQDKTPKLTPETSLLPWLGKETT